MKATDAKHRADDMQRLLRAWHLRVTTAQFGHLHEADRNRFWGLMLGIPVVAFSTIVGTSVFAALNRGVRGGVAVVMGSISVLSAVLASIQTFLGYSQVAERHRVAAARYAAMRRVIEVMLIHRSSTDLNKLRPELDKVGAASPIIKAKWWRQATEEAKQAIKEWNAGDRDATASVLEL